MRLLRRKIERRLAALTKTFSRKGLYEFLDVQFSSIEPGSRVLTIGSGGGVHDLLLSHSESGRFQVVSLDIELRLKPDIVADVCLAPLDPGHFDFLVVSEVLEHLHSPHLAVSNFVEILRPGGRLILTTPFILPLHDRPRDYYRYTRYGLEFLLRGFTDVEIKERNSYFDAIDVLWARLWQTQLQRARLACYAILPYLVLKRPLSRLLTRLIPTDAMTTGYVVTASRPGFLASSRPEIALFPRRHHGSDRQAETTHCGEGHILPGEETPWGGNKA